MCDTSAERKEEEEEDKEEDEEKGEQLARLKGHRMKHRDFLKFIIQSHMRKNNF